MVLVKEQIQIGPGISTEIRFKQIDMVKEHLHREMPYDTTLVVRYVDNSGSQWEEDYALVDKNATSWYKTISALHCKLFLGNEDRMFVPNVFQVKEDEICACIELFVISLAPESERIKLMKMRKRMYEQMIEYELCKPEHERSVLKTIAILNKELEDHSG